MVTIEIIANISHLPLNRDRCMGNDVDVRRTLRHKDTHGRCMEKTVGTGIRNPVLGGEIHIRGCGQSFVYGIPVLEKGGDEEGGLRF
jgi:hypothetical protein